MFDWDSKRNYLIYFRNASNRNADKENAEESVIGAEWHDRICLILVKKDFNSKTFFESFTF